MKYIWLLVRTGFYLSLALFLVQGTVLVLSQFGGVFSLSPELISYARSGLGPTTFAMSTICSLFAFVLSYHKHFEGLTEEDGEGVALEISEHPDVPDALEDVRLNKHLPDFEDRKLKGSSD